MRAYPGEYGTLFAAHWQPKVIAEMNDYQQKIELLLIEPRGVLNTRHAGGERPAANDV